MKHVLILISAIILSLSSCTNNAEESSTSSQNNENLISETIPVTKAKDIIANNSYIDYDPDALLQYAIDDLNWQEKHPEEYEMSKAALYRYYSNISEENGQWTCSATAKDLNLSERVFKQLDDNTKENNQLITDNSKNGEKVIRPTPSKEYLEALLK